MSPQFFPPVPADTGWVAITSFGAGWSGAALGAFPAAAVRRIGSVVYLRGLLTKAGAYGSSETMCTLPVGFRPPGSAQIPGNPTSAYALTSGAVTTNASGTGNLLLTGSFTVD